MLKFCYITKCFIYYPGFICMGNNSTGTGILYYVIEFFGLHCGVKHDKNSVCFQDTEKGDHRLRGIVQKDQYTILTLDTHFDQCISELDG